MRIQVWAPDVAGFGGGIGAFTRELAAALADAGHEVVLLGKNDRAAFGRTAKFSAAVMRACASRRPELVISTHVHFGPLARWVRRLFGVPFVLVAHGVEVGPDLPPARRAALVAADGVWAVSRWTRDRLRALGVPAERIRVVGNTVAEDRYAPGPRSPVLMRRYDIGAGEKVVLTVARLDAAEAYKGYDQVLRALPLLPASAGSVRHLVVGQGDDAARLRELAASLGDSERLILAGFVPDAELAEHYRLADVFAMPSRGEGFGIVFLEAMASGVPVLAGNRDGSVDALADGELGALVDPEDAGAIARALEDLLHRKGPSAWFDPDALRAACLARHGRAPFRGKIGTDPIFGQRP